ncbi:unnamed protein product [Oikopleura dioica]|uniref:Uncharacterized protein n=1 Tax=Oikopleura dioica TaxID=34765 RepID=E4XX50_OIKDI|nr:unnamed protein product [Oikopleura dioica]
MSGSPTYGTGDNNVLQQTQNQRIVKQLLPIFSRSFFIFKKCMNLLFNDKERCTAAVATLTLKFGFDIFSNKFFT